MLKIKICLCQYQYCNPGVIFVLHFLSPNLRRYIDVKIGAWDIFESKGDGGYASHINNKISCCDQVTECWLVPLIDELVTGGCWWGEEDGCCGGNIMVGGWMVGFGRTLWADKLVWSEKKTLGNPVSAFKYSRGDQVCILLASTDLVENDISAFKRFNWGKPKIALTVTLSPGPNNMKQGWMVEVYTWGILYCTRAVRLLSGLSSAWVWQSRLVVSFNAQSNWMSCNGCGSLYSV